MVRVLTHILSQLGDIFPQKISCSVIVTVFETVNHLINFDSILPNFTNFRSEFLTAFAMPPDMYLEIFYFGN